VKAGDVIGFVGLSGVRHSEPHLHFTIAVQDPSGADGRYLDPEPLIALWPVRASSPDERLRVAAAPAGLARGFLRRRHRHHVAQSDSD
jgi:murein DD-endopeptidase MepM/ murein hydrolase activator NlpD